MMRSIVSGPKSQINSMIGISNRRQSIPYYIIANDWIGFWQLVNDCIYYQRLPLDGCGPLWTTNKPGQFGKKLTGFE